MSTSPRPQQRRVRRRPSLLAELTDEIEPDEGPSLRQRLIAMLMLVLAVAVFAGAVAFVIMQTLSRTR